MKLHLVLLGIIFATMIGCCARRVNAGLPDTRIVDATEYADTVAFFRYILETDDPANIARLLTTATVGPDPGTGTVTMGAGAYTALFGTGGVMQQLGWNGAEKGFLREYVPSSFRIWMLASAQAMLPSMRGVSQAVEDATTENEFTVWWGRQVRLRR